jgi:hypothetical protein
MSVGVRKAISSCINGLAGTKHSKLAKAKYPRTPTTIATGSVQSFRKRIIFIVVLFFGVQSK